MTDAEIIEEAIRDELGKPEGELTVADLEKVKLLALTSTKITDAGLKEVAKMEKLTNLSLYGCDQITDAGLKELAKLKQLEGLVLVDTKITKAGVAELQKALPKCRIESNPKK